MGFSEFQQLGLTRHVSSVLVESETDSSDDEFDDTLDGNDSSFALLSPHDRWKKSAKRVLLAQRFVSEVKDSMNNRKYTKLVRRKLRILIETFLMSPAEALFTRSILNAKPYTRNSLKIWPYCLLKSVVLRYPSKTRKRKASVAKTLGWLVAKSVWQQPFEHLLVRNLLDQQVIYNLPSLFNGLSTLTARHIIEVLIDSAFDFAGFYDPLGNKSEEESSYLQIAKSCFALAVQYYVPGALCNMHLLMQTEQGVGKSFWTISNEVYDQNGIMGFVAPMGPSILCAVSSIVVHLCTRWILDISFPKEFSHKQHRRQVFHNRFELQKAAGKVLEIADARELKEYIKEQPALLVLMHDTSPASIESCEFAKDVAREFSGDILVLLMNVNLLSKPAEEYGSSVPLWMPILNGKPLPFVDNSEVRRLGSRMRLVVTQKL